jgi:hypothetical protein
LSPLLSHSGQSIKRITDYDILVVISFCMGFLVLPAQSVPHPHPHPHCLGGPATQVNGSQIASGEHTFIRSFGDKGSDGGRNVPSPERVSKTRQRKYSYSLVRRAHCVEKMLIEKIIDMLDTDEEESNCIGTSAFGASCTI